MNDAQPNTVPSPAGTDDFNEGRGNEAERPRLEAFFFTVLKVKPAVWHIRKIVVSSLIINCMVLVWFGLVCFRAPLTRRERIAWLVGGSFDLHPPLRVRA